MSTSTPDPRVLVEDDNPTARLHSYHTPCNWIQRVRLKKPVSVRHHSEVADHRWCSYKGCCDSPEKRVLGLL